jgi:hypothetical protein
VPRSIPSAVAASVPDQTVDACAGGAGRTCPPAIPPSSGHDNLLAGLRGSLQADHSTAVQATHGHAMMSVGCGLLLPSALTLSPFRRTRI